MRDPLRDLLEQEVPDAVPERIVDVLEPVEIEKQRRQLGVHARGLGKRAIDPVLKKRGFGRPVKPSCSARYSISASRRACARRCPEPFPRALPPCSGIVQHLPLAVDMTGAAVRAARS